MDELINSAMAKCMGKIIDSGGGAKFSNVM